jgi:uncharacterized caspase-like protein
VRILKVAWLARSGARVKAFFLVVALAGALIGVITAPVDAATAERRVALVVGNARYADAPLRNPANDARAMAASLRERGFEVILRLDATKPQMEGAIIEFGEKLTEGATGLFFYAGHGMQVQGRNYIIPTDAKLTSEQRIKLEAVDVEAVLDQMQGARSKVNVVILDACRNNPFERRFRSASGGLAQINAPEGTLIAYATAPGRVAADGEGANGLYTTELLKALRAPGLKVEDVFKQVRINVARASNGAQTPWEASSLIGDFYFVAPVAAAPSNTLELEFWNAIKTAQEPGEYRAYLTRYPKGEFAELAQMRLASIEKSRADAIERARDATAEKARLDAAERARSEAAEKARADAAEKARAEAAEKARAEIEKIRLEAAERSRLEIEKARREVTENSRAEIERVRLAATAGRPTPTPPAEAAKPVQQAALPPPSAPISAFDGIYNAKFTMIGQDGFAPLNAAIEITKNRIAGTAANAGGTGCTVSGELEDTGTIKSLFMSCRKANVHFTGRFAIDPNTGMAVGNTEARSIMDGRVVPVTWVGGKPVQQAALPSPAAPAPNDTSKSGLTAAQKLARGLPVTYADLEGHQYFAQQNYLGGHRGFEIKFDFSGKDPSRIMVHGRIELDMMNRTPTTFPFISCPIYGFDRFKQNLQFTAYCLGGLTVIGDLSTMTVTFMHPGLDPRPVTVVDSGFSDTHREWTKGVNDNNTAAFFQDVLKEKLTKSPSSGG